MKKQRRRTIRLFIKESEFYQRELNGTNSMLVQITDIVVNPDRRGAVMENVKKLANSISEVGLLHPILIDREQTLIAGLHRLEAAKLLGWSEIECTVSTLEGMQIQLAEIDENFVRCDLSAIEHGDLLLRRKEIYEALHPETRHGGNHMHNHVEKSKTSKCRFASARSFAEDTAEKLGIGRRTVERQVQMAKNLTEEAKKVIRDTDTRITKKEALKLSRLNPEQQVEAAKALSRGEISTVEDYSRQQESSQTASEIEAISDGKCGEVIVPFCTDNRPYTSFQESVAELKNPDIDRSCTPDSFLEEITAFVRKFHTEIEWYYNPYYEAVFPAITPLQLQYLRSQMNLICSAADKLYTKVERIIMK